MGKPKKVTEPIYEAIGYTTNEMTPNVVSGLILEDKITGAKFKATVLESRTLYDEGKLKLPDSFE